MKFSEDFLFALGLFSIFLIASAVGSFALFLNYYSDQQVRVMYQTAYQKNIECRMAYSKSGFTNSLLIICGPIPKFEDYINE